jgi:hypothetical protein
LCGSPHKALKPSTRNKTDRRTQRPPDLRATIHGQLGQVVRRGRSLRRRVRNVRIQHPRIGSKNTVSGAPKQEGNVRKGMDKIENVTSLNGKTCQETNGYLRRDLFGYWTSLLVVSITFTWHNYLMPHKPTPLETIGLLLGFLPNHYPGSCPYNHCRCRCHRRRSAHDSFNQRCKRVRKMRQLPQFNVYQNKILTVNSSNSDSLELTAPTLIGP